MTQIKRIVVSVEPSRWNDERYGVLHKVDVTVDAYGHEPLQHRELIPDDDFTRRFDWMIDKARREVIKHMEAKE